MDYHSFVYNSAHGWESPDYCDRRFAFPMPFREFLRSLHIHSEDETRFPVELDRELDDLRKFSLALLMAFLTVHEISESNALGAATLALLVYTINLHIAVSARLLRNTPILSRFLHTVPLLGLFGMIIFKLVITVRSPAVAAAVLLTCTLLPLIIAIRPVRWYAESFWRQDLVPVVPGPGDLPVVSS